MNRIDKIITGNIRKILFRILIPSNSLYNLFTILKMKIKTNKPVPIAIKSTEVNGLLMYLSPVAFATKRVKIR